MTFLPIVERELRVASRLSSTYRNRWITAGVVAMVALFSISIASMSGGGSFVGSGAFHLLSGLAAVFCLFEGVRKTADCLSEEKRAGTLGLLFLTDLKGYDVVLGKLAGLAVSSIYGLVAILPILALPLLVGGVLPGEYWRTALALLNMLFFSLCTGMMISALSRSEQKAIGMTLAILGALALLPVGVGSPLYAYRMAGLNYQLERYWEGMGWTQAISWFFLICAALIVPRSWRETGRQDRRSFWSRPIILTRRYHAGRVAERRELLEANPIMWLAMRQPGQRTVLYCCQGAALLAAVAFGFAGDNSMAPGYFGVCWLINFAVKIWVAMKACQVHVEARRNNAMEMLLVTPLRAERIVQAQVQSIWRLCMGPIVILLAIELAGLVCSAMSSTSRTQNLGDSPVTYLFSMIYIALFALDLSAATWAGIWFGLAAKKEGQAVSKTVIYVLLLPYATVILSCFGVPFGLLMPFFWIGWCRSKLRRSYRETAVERVAFSRPDSAPWEPAISAAGVAPAGRIL